MEEVRLTPHHNASLNITREAMLSLHKVAIFTTLVASLNERPYYPETPRILFPWQQQVTVGTLYAHKLSN